MTKSETYGKTDAEVDYKNGKKFMMFSPELAYLGIEVSPGTSEFLKHLTVQSKILNCLDLKYQGIGFEFNNQSDNIYLYNEILEENQSKGQALQRDVSNGCSISFSKRDFIPTFEFQYFVPKEKRDLLYDDSSKRA